MRFSPAALTYVLKLVAAGLATGAGAADAGVAPSPMATDDASGGDGEEADDACIFYDGADCKLMKDNGSRPWSSRREMVARSRESSR